MVYDRSSFIYATALAIDVLNIIFERKSTRLDMVMLPAFIKGMATTTNMMVRFFKPNLIFSSGGRV